MKVSDFLTVPALIAAILLGLWSNVFSVYIPGCSKCDTTKPGAACPASGLPPLSNCPAYGGQGGCPFGGVCQAAGDAGTAGTCRFKWKSTCTIVPCPTGTCSNASAFNCDCDRGANGC